MPPSPPPPPPKYETLMKEMRRKLKEAKASADHIGRQDAEFERLSKLGRKELIEELRKLRAELTPKAIGKMAKHEIVNEIIRLTVMIEADKHVPYTDEEVADAKMKDVPKFVQKKAKLTAVEAQHTRPAQDTVESKNPSAKSRKASPLLLRVAAKRKQGLSLKEAWAAVKAEDAK